MPFETPAGQAVLVENICEVNECAARLGVHMNSIYSWIKNRDRNNFPKSLPCGEYHLDYEEVYEWFTHWVKAHPHYYPVAYREMFTEAPA